VNETVTLREHFEALLEAADLRYAQRFNATEAAITKAETSLDRRISLLNELRGGVATREQLEAAVQRIEDLTGRLNRSEGRSGGFQQSWLVIVGAVTIAGIIGGILAKHF